MSAQKDFLLPDLGEGLTDSEIVSWQVAVGDHVELNQTLGEVETAKALVELPSPFDGVVSRLYAEPGATVQVGSPIVRFEVEDGNPADGADAIVEEAAGAEAQAGGEARAGARADAGVEAETDAGAGARARAESRADTAEGRVASGRQSVLVGYGPPIEDGARPVRRPRIARSVPPPPLEEHGEPSSLPHRDERATEPSSQREVHGETRLPITGVRRRTAEAMVSSAFTAPQATEFLTVDVTQTIELLDAARRMPDHGDTRIGMLAITARAVALAAARTPEINSRWDSEASEIVQFGYLNLGIATATPRGLLVPNLKDAGRMTVPELARAIATLVDDARAARSATDELTGGTITITNVGVFGVDAGTPILNPGEAAILALGAVRRRPWEYRGEVALRQVVTLGVTFDHRLVDGEQASRFLTDVGAVLENPGTALVMV